MPRIGASASVQSQQSIQGHNDPVHAGLEETGTGIETLSPVNQAGESPGSLRDIVILALPAISPTQRELEPSQGRQPE